ncbi:hypothetical protein C8R43DRAFT_1145739 [Mycena crocata]|nr:hypothetical protein C8R43DRAFT_1145739 [Mycena crocata]
MSRSGVRAQRTAGLLLPAAELADLKKRVIAAGVPRWVRTRSRWRVLLGDDDDGIGRRPEMKMEMQGVSSGMSPLALTSPARRGTLNLRTAGGLSRANVQALVAPAGALLRFVATLLPPESALLAGLLHFYDVRDVRAYCRHGALTICRRSGVCARLMRGWSGLLESWIVCATDPYQTPDREILWNQVIIWKWGVCSARVWASSRQIGSVGGNVACEGVVA